MFSNNYIPNKLKNEKRIIIVRRDLFILLKKILFSLFLILLPIIVYKIIFLQFITFTPNSLQHIILVLGSLIYFLSIWLFFLFLFIDYYLDIWIVTNRRIISIEQNGFFSRTIAEVKLFRVQDVKSESHGLMPTILKYGSVHIQSAGTNPNFHFEEVPHPEKIKDTVIQLVQRNKRIFKNEEDIDH